MLCVCIVVCISSKASTEVEEATVRNGVLIIVAGKILVHLPPQSGRYQNRSMRREKDNSPSTAYSLYRHSFGLGIEHCLCKRKPRRLIRRRILEIGLSSRHGSHSPESLIIVTHGLGPIRGHHIVVFSNLPLYSCFDNVVVRRIAGEMPIIDQGSPHCARFPPVIWTKLAIIVGARVPSSTYIHSADSAEGQVIHQGFHRSDFHGSMSSYRRLSWRLHS
jgi:hypothetical protein